MIKCITLERLALLSEARRLVEKAKELDDSFAKTQKFNPFIIFMRDYTISIDDDYLISLSDEGLKVLISNTKMLIESYQEELA